MLLTPVLAGFDISRSEAGKSARAPFPKTTNHEHPMSDPTTPSLPVEMTSPAAPAIPRTKNTLTLPQLLKLADWCRAYPDDCAKKTYPELADIATVSLKFTVTAANMSSTIEACGIERKKPDAPPTVEEQLAALRQELDALRQDAGESKALRGTLEEILAAMRALTARVGRLERIEEDRNGRTDVPEVPVHPELGLPVPAFGETPPFNPTGALHGLESAQ